MSQSQYFNNSQLEEIGKSIKIGNLTLVSTDTYSDFEIWESIRNTGKVDLLLCSAIQMCVVGFGKKVYGYFEHKGIKYDVKDLFSELGVKMYSNLSDKLAPNELTPRRIQRFFRVQIRNYLEANPSIYPYLWRKYSTRDIKYRHTTYPGAESCLTQEDELEYLIQTYKELDQRNETRINERICRVIEARGYGHRLITTGKLEV